MRISRSRLNFDRLIILFLAAGFLFTSCEEQRQIEKVVIEVDRIQEKYAPDRRIARFDIDVRSKNDTINISGQTTSVEAHAELVNYLNNNGIAYKDAVITFPDSTVGDDIYAVVNVSVANIRSEPAHSAELATQELMGVQLHILSSQDDWYFVQTPNQYLGWLDEGAIIRMTETEWNSYDKLPKYRIEQISGWVYEEADPTSQVMSDIVAGVVIIDRDNISNGYRAVSLPDGREGYVLDYDNPVFDRKNGNDIVQTARQFLGVPYLWGGTSAKGFDCSGYTKTVYDLHGYLLPRDASQQIFAGKQITTDKSLPEVQQGDLLFFGKPRDNGTIRISHVAIYIGDGEVIHATGRVKIESLRPGAPNFAKERYDTFVEARRIEL